MTHNSNSRCILGACSLILGLNARNVIIPARATLCGATGTGVLGPKEPFGVVAKSLSLPELEPIENPNRFKRPLETGLLSSISFPRNRGRLQFIDLNLLIRFDIEEGLDNLTRPSNFNGVGDAIFAQA